MDSDSSHRRSSAPKRQSDFQTIPGASSNITPHFISQSQSDRCDHQTLQPPALKRSKTSQPSRHGHRPRAVNMMPSRSSPYSRATGMALSLSTPYTAASAMAQVPNYVGMGRFSQSQIHASLPYRPTQNQQTFNQVDLDIGMEPGQYIMAQDSNNASHHTLSHSIPGEVPPFGIGHMNFDLGDFSIPTSSCGSLTENATLNSALSTSFGDGINDNVSVPIDMAHSDSRRSHMNDFGYYNPSPSELANDDAGSMFQFDKVPLSSDEAVQGTGSGYLSVSKTHDAALGMGYFLPSSHNLERTESANTYSSFDPDMYAGTESLATQHNADSQFFSAHMERTTSATSTKSNISSRAKLMLRRQVENADKIRLQPKEHIAPIAATAGTTHAKVNHGGATLHDATGDCTNNGRVEIAKARRERPKTKKLYCNRCDACPQGFRGEHELRRHNGSKHGATVKKWICSDPRKRNEETSVEAIRPLSECKHCSDQKTYGIYYNAAEHLRRSHFKAKVSRKGGNRSAPAKKNVKPEHTEDWPPMSELKKWMVEVTIRADNASDAGDKEAEDPVDDFFFEQQMPMDDSAVEHGAGAFDDAALQTQNLLGMGLGFPAEYTTKPSETDSMALNSVDLRFDSTNQESMYGMFPSDTVTAPDGFDTTTYMDNYILSGSTVGLDTFDAISSPSATLSQETARLTPSAVEQFDIYSSMNII